MVLKKLGIEIKEGETEGVTYSGARKRRRTVLIEVRGNSLSKRAFELGLLLASLQLLDAVLTMIGLRIYGIEMEGNSLLAKFMTIYGTFPAILATKLFALVVVAFMTWYAHSRTWFRPVIAALCAAYMLLAVIPWVYYVLAAQGQAW